MPAPRTKQLFISYRSSDAVKVDKIARDLGLLRYDDGTPRYTPWQDKHNLPPASPSWWDAIVEAIERCDMFVFYVSLASLQSEVCRAELDYAYRRNRPIVPVVLDGEFFLDPTSGKYNLFEDIWTFVPDWLGQTQLIFYIPTEFYGRFQTAVELFERNWPRDIPTPRPLNPDAKSVHGSNHALYSAACDYAERLALADAETHFRALIRRNDSDYADLAELWLKVIGAYGELLEMITHNSPPVVFNRKWAAYQGVFPNDALDRAFDPKGLARRSGGEQERLARQKVEDERIESDKAESDRLEIENERLARENVKTNQVSTAHLLPPPFEWIKIPGGSGMMKTNEGIKLAIPTETYWMSKYPITNEQYAKFIQVGGYHEERWWTDTGWETRQKAKWIEPRYWHQTKWNGAEQPVVGISWFEAVAFCLWLSEATSKDILLPTEAQWQYAAQGQDGLIYPWGNEWGSAHCNNRKNSIRHTTPVYRYEGKGDSPFGVVDMVGNVWEWSLTDYNNHTHDVNSVSTRRVLRGGSWYGLRGSAGGMCRDFNIPIIRNDQYGFRLVLRPHLNTRDSRSDPENSAYAPF